MAQNTIYNWSFSLSKFPSSYPLHSHDCHTVHVTHSQTLCNLKLQLEIALIQSQLLKSSLNFMLCHILSPLPGISFLLLLDFMLLLIVSFSLNATSNPL